MKKTFEMKYKPFDLKELHGKSGYLIYGYDEGSKEGNYSVELLVFCDSNGNHYLISEKAIPHKPSEKL